MFSVTTVTHHTDDTHHPSIIVTNRDGFKYIFGKVPEGAQRVITENKIKLGKLRLIFLTGTTTSWLEIGGLPGLFLTMTDATSRGLDVFAPCQRALTYMVATWRSFVFRKGMDLNILPTSDCGIFGDSNIAIKAIRIPSSVDPLITIDLKRDEQLRKLVSRMFPRDTSKVNNPDPNSYQVDPSDTEIHTHTSLPKASQILELQSQESVSYCIRFLPLRGKFDVARAKALGVPPGIKFKELAAGNSVQNEAGESIKPEQVMLPPQKFCKMLLIDIPHAQYLENTLQSPKWFAQDADMGSEDLGLVYHFLGPDIDCESPRYRQFLDKFPPECKHVISHPKFSSNNIVFKRAAEHLLMLKCVQPNHFNLANISNEAISNKNNTYLLQQHQEFQILPHKIEYNDLKVTRDDWSLLYDKVIPPLLIPDAEKSSIVDDPPLTLNIDSKRDLKDQVHVVTLGTGLALPSIFRNVISTLVRIPWRKPNGEISVRLVLFDGGENTLGSLARNFKHGDAKQYQQIFQELLLIFLSHLHADHHLGLVPVIRQWLEINREGSQKLYLVAPWQYDTFIREWFAAEQQQHQELDLASRLVYISCEDFLESRSERKSQILKMDMDEFESRLDSRDVYRQIEKEPIWPIDSESIEKMYANLGIAKMETCRAIHCAWAYSTSIKFQVGTETDTFQVSYSGDTRPNPRFKDIGFNSDLLIHESSLECDLIEEAIAKKHSTMIEAVTVCRRMNCPKAILTHFSTRYSNNNNISTSIHRLEAESSKLARYLTETNAYPNIFNVGSSRRPVKKFDELQICFAYDFMNVRYDTIDSQKRVEGTISRIFTDGPEEEAEEEETKRKAKDAERVEAKREARLTARLAKRRKS